MIEYFDSLAQTHPILAIHLLVGLTLIALTLMVFGLSKLFPTPPYVVVRDVPQYGYKVVNDLNGKANRIVITDEKVFNNYVLSTTKGLK